MVEENLGPLPQIVSSLVEIASLMESSGPLNQVVALVLFLLRSEVGIIELLLPSLVLLLTISHTG